MARRSRTSHVVKWGGVVVSVAIAGVFLLSLRYEIEIAWDSWGVGFQLGSLRIEYLRNYGALRRREAWIRADPLAAALGGWMPLWPAQVDFTNAGLRDPTLPKPTTKWLYVPLWMPFLVIAVPTALLWRQRRFARGHCQHCGYDLTGNVSGRCPECGATCSVADRRVG
jgi:hypothetical protein